MGEMKVGHTPEPWIALPFGDCAYEVMAPDGTVIAVIDGAPDESAVLEASARLIAAAPELLAALLALADRVAVVIESDADDGKPEDAELRTAWDAAGVAIAKAEGR